LPGRGTRVLGNSVGLALRGRLSAGGVDARLWLPGAREPGREAYVAELEREAVRLGIADAVAFAPPTDAIARAYAASDLVLQLSRKPEAFGRTVLEALCVGRPVLGWAHGGVGELLARFQPAGEVPAFDAERLYASAVEMLARPPRPPASIPLTLQAMQESTLGVYHELAG
jgi:glycosyltransferase involved in cell wall biosynthesis